MAGTEPRGQCGQAVDYRTVENFVARPATVVPAHEVNLMLGLQRLAHLLYAHVPGVIGIPDVTDHHINIPCNR
jgi:hypothetical protein